MIHEWIWDKIRSKLARAKEIKKYLMDIKNAEQESTQSKREVTNIR